MGAVRIKGYRGLQAGIHRAQSAAVDGTDEAVQTVIRRGAYEIAANAPVLTGKLQRSVSAQTDGIHVDAPYASYVEDRKPFIAPVVVKLPGWLAEETAEAIKRKLPL